jgi:MraZ protein
MEPNAATETTLYSWEYLHGVDEKRRVQIPAKWRSGQPNEKLMLIVWPKSKEGPCLNALPLHEMAKLLHDIDAMPNGDPNKGVLKRLIGGGSDQVEIDKAGRICLPDRMAKEAGISDDAILVGCLNRFEIWNPGRYERVKVSDAVMAQEAFKMME